MASELSAVRVFPDFEVLRKRPRPRHELVQASVLRTRAGLKK
jgi:hypothetical protein